MTGNRTRSFGFAAMLTMSCAPDNAARPDDGGDAPGDASPPADALAAGDASPLVDADAGADAVSADPVDLRAYFPATQSTQVFRQADGSLYSTYTYLPATPDFTSLYDSFFSLAKPGQLYIWAKGYGASGCIATYAHLFLGDDESVTEVGDYYANDGCHPSVAFGYGGGGDTNDGLAWSAEDGLPVPGGAGQPAARFGLRIRRQSNAGDPYLESQNLAWNQTSLVEVLPTYTPPYGRSPSGVWAAGAGKTYSNVVRIVFWHGTQVPDQAPIACTPDPTWPYASYYYSLPGYHTYASEYYLAEGKWIIQEAFLYTEDGSYWDLGNCVGLSFDRNPAWVTYIDEP